MRYHTSFARHGDPNVQKSPDAPDWPPFDNDTSSLGSSHGGVSLVFALPAAGGVRVENGYRERQCDYWDTLPDGPD
jgi:hypothetical protein